MFGALRTQQKRSFSANWVYLVVLGITLITKLFIFSLTNWIQFGSTLEKGESNKNNCRLKRLRSEVLALCDRDPRDHLMVCLKNASQQNVLVSNY